jgi:hypothetical protein
MKDVVYAERRIFIAMLSITTLIVAMHIVAMLSLVALLWQRYKLG